MKEIKINLKTIGPVLDRLFLFKSLDPAMKYKFLGESVVVIAEKGETIIREGGPEMEVYILIDGEVEVRTRREGKEVFLSVLKPNAIIGEMSAITQKPRSATVEALTPCSLLKIKAEVIQEIFHKNPRVRTLLMAVRQGREKDTMEKLQG